MCEAISADYSSIPNMNEWREMNGLLLNGKMPAFSRRFLDMMSMSWMETGMLFLDTPNSVESGIRTRRNRMPNHGLESTLNPRRIHGHSPRTMGREMMKCQ